MTDTLTVSRELLRQVLVRLEIGGPEWERDNMIKALRAALEQPAPVQEPPGRCPSCMTYNGHQDGCPTTPQPAPAERTVQEPSCKWPSCQTEQYQNDLADHIAKELIGEQPRKAVKLTDSEVEVLWTGDEWGHFVFARAIEAAFIAKNGWAG